jgi:Tol biopolymer transport system component
MIRKIVLIINILFFFGLFFYQDALSWDDEVTHKDLSRSAGENSVLSLTGGDYLKSIGFQDGLNEELVWDGNKVEIIEWLSLGAELEDAGNISEIIIGKGRFSNHFHNPMKSKDSVDPNNSWEDAGLDDWFVFHYTGRSSLLWAQESDKQQTFREGDWSWKTTRDYFYFALTSITSAEREENFAKMFRGLGHQMHLIQDSAVPAHVRNDAHPLKRNRFETTLETWAAAEKNRSFINSLASNPVYPQVSLNTQIDHDNKTWVPITQLVDTDYYNGTNPSAGLAIGLAEYSNANFFSDDTIFSAERYQSDPNHRHFFPYPKKSSTNLQQYIAQIPLPETRTAYDGVQDLVLPPISKVSDGELVSYFLRPTYFTNEPEVGEVEATYHKSFFRDEECHRDYAALLIPRAVGYSAELLNYFFRGAINIVSDHAKVSAYVIENKSEEDMEGTFELFYDNVNDERTRLWIIGDPDHITIPANGASENINFAAPADAKEPGRYILVFRGRLGNESNAVAARVITYPSRIAFSYQPGGGGNVSDIYTILPDGKDEIKITNSSDGLPYKFNPAWSPNGDKLAFDAHGSDPFNTNIIIIDMTSDQHYPANRLMIFDTGGGAEEWHDFSPDFSPDGQKIVAVNDVTDAGTRLGSRLIIIDVATGSWYALTDFMDGFIRNPKWSPKGDKIVYDIWWAEPEIYEDIWLINADGSGNVTLTNDEYYDAGAVWTPDGQRIIFTSDRDGGDYMDLWIMDSTGQNQSQIAGWSVDVHSPSVSPEGNKVVFSNMADLYIYNMDAGSLTTLVGKGFYTMSGDWSLPIIGDSSPN